jgi:hypothetical protein
MLVVVTNEFAENRFKLVSMGTPASGQGDLTPISVPPLCDSGWLLSPLGSEGYREQIRAFTRR